MTATSYCHEVWWFSLPTSTNSLRTSTNFLLTLYWLCWLSKIFVSKVKKYLCLKLKIFVSKVKNICVRSLKYLCQKFKIFVSKVKNICAKSQKYLCQKSKIFVSKVKNISTDFYWLLLTLYWLLLTLYWLLLTLYWLSTGFYWLSTDSLLDCLDLLCVWTIEKSWEHSKLHVGWRTGRTGYTSDHYYS